MEQQPQRRKTRRLRRCPRPRPQVPNLPHLLLLPPRSSSTTWSTPPGQRRRAPGESFFFLLLFCFQRERLPQFHIFFLPCPSSALCFSPPSFEKKQKKRKRPLADLVFVFHLLAFLWFSRVWAWHLGKQASTLPGSKGFGWFFRYLTFCSFTAQTATLALCCAAHLTMRVRVVRALAAAEKEKEGKEERIGGGESSSNGKGSDGNSAPLPPPPLTPTPTSTSSPSPLWLYRAADDAACAIFGLANVVTLMYFAIERSSAGNLVEGGRAARPAWLGAAVHSLNAVVAWTDLLLAHPRSFSPRAARASVALALGYCHWLLLVRGVTGRFPYPILNKMPMPWGFFFLIGTGIVLFWVLFQIGKKISSPLLRYKTRFGWPAE